MFDYKLEDSCLNKTSTKQDGFLCRLTGQLHENKYARNVSFMAEPDASQEALEQVQKITDSEPVNGEELVESEDLKRQFREAKERLESELP